MASATVHGKAAVTGKGQVEKPPSSGAQGPSNHVPQIGKAQPRQPDTYSSEQQQQGSS
jgi:hypothetical protein